MFRGLTVKCASRLADAELIPSLAREYCDQTSEPNTKSSSTIAAANAKLAVRRGFAAPEWARCHTDTKLGAVCSSASRAALNSARSLLSSPIISISYFHARQVRAQMFLAAFVMLARAADRNAHHDGSFAQTQIFIKDQMQSFALSLRQSFQRGLKIILKFSALKGLGRVLFRGDLFFRLGKFRQQPQRAQDLAAILSCGCLSDHRKKPRLQARFTAIERFAFKDLQIDSLQNFFGIAGVAATATKRPAETGAVELFQFGLQLRDVHLVTVHRKFRVHGISRLAARIV